MKSEFQQTGIYVQRGAFAAGELQRYRELARRIQAKTRQHLYPGTRFWYAARLTLQPRAQAAQKPR